MSGVPTERSTTWLGEGGGTLMFYSPDDQDCAVIAAAAGAASSFRQGLPRTAVCREVRRYHGRAWRRAAAGCENARAGGWLAVMRSATTQRAFPKAVRGADGLPSAPPAYHRNTVMTFDGTSRAGAGVPARRRRRPQPTVCPFSDASTLAAPISPKTPVSPGVRLERNVRVMAAATGATAADWLDW